MKSQVAFGRALRLLREHRQMSQEDFSDVSGRTYISMLERGQKSPTIEKVDQLSSALGVHPLTLLAATFAERDGVGHQQLLERVQAELSELKKL